MVIAKHSVELCPRGVIRPDKGFTAKLDESIKKSGVKEIAGYLDGRNHLH